MKISKKLFRTNRTVGIFCYKNCLLILSILLLILFNFTAAEWAVNPYLNYPVCTATGEQHSPKVIGASDGSTIIIWQDQRHGHEDIYAQKIDSNGDPLWDKNGVSVISAGSDQYDFSAISDNDGGIIVVWRDNRYDSQGDIYGQRINSEGTKLWREYGKEFARAVNYQGKPKIVKANSGTFFITWLDKRNDPVYSDIFFQKIKLSGSALLEGNIGITSIRFGQYDIAYDKKGGFYAAWAARYIVYLQRVGSDGNVLWDSNAAIEFDDYYAITSLFLPHGTSSGVTALWSTELLGSWDFYSAQVSSDGVVVNSKSSVSGAWSLLSQYTEYNPNSHRYYIIGSWGDTGELQPFLYKLDEKRNQVWSSELNPLAFDYHCDGTTHPDDVYASGFTFLSDKTIITVYDRRREYFRAQRVDNDGSLMWDEIGIPVSFEATEVSLVGYGEKGTVIALCKNDDIYVQKINENGTWGQIDPQRVYYLDDFQAPSAVNWSPKTDSRWEIVHDPTICRYTLTTSRYKPVPPDRLGEYSVFTPQKFFNFNCAFQVKSEEDIAANPEADYAFVFGYLNQQNYSFIQFKKDRIKIRSIVDGTAMPWVTDRSISISDEEFQETTVYVRKKDRIVTVTFNGYDIVSSSNHFSHGLVGVGSWNDAMSIDNFFITSKKQSCISMSMDDVTGSPTDTVYLDIAMDNATQNITPVAGIQMTLDHTNSSAFSIGDAETTARTSGFSISTSMSSSQATIMLYHSGGTTVSSGTGPICRLPVTLSSTVDRGECSDFSFNEVLLSDEEGDPIPACYSDGAKVCAAICEPCDANEDGEKNIFDIVKIVNCALGRDTCNDCADYNNDGDINIFDVIGCVNEIQGKLKKGRPAKQNGPVMIMPEFVVTGNQQFIRLQLSSGQGIQGCQFDLTGDISDIETSQNQSQPAIKIYSAKKGDRLSIVAFTDLKRSELVYDNGIMIPVQGVTKGQALQIGNIYLADVDARSVPFHLQKHYVQTKETGLEKVNRTELKQNYPNPANPGTKITYTLAQKTDIRLVIYNSNGQVIRELENSLKPAGKYHVHWDGRDQTGKIVSNGVYFYSLKTNERTSIKKMIILK